MRSEADAIAGRWAARTEALERALVHAQRASDPREISTIIGLLAGALLYGPTPVPEAIRRCEELSESVRGDVEVRAGIASTLAGLHAMLGQFDQARTLSEEARAIYEELGLRYIRAGVHSFAAGSIELLAGDPVGAVRELRSGYDELELMGERGTRSTLAAFLAQALVDRSDYADAILPSVRRNETLRLWASRYARLVLERCRGNKREACRVLGISYHTLQAYVRLPPPSNGEETPVPVNNVLNAIEGIEAAAIGAEPMDCSNTVAIDV